MEFVIHVKLFLTKPSMQLFKIENFFIDAHILFVIAK